jgi:acyl-CoA dehydrogenase
MAMMLLGVVCLVSSRRIPPWGVAFGMVGILAFLSFIAHGFLSGLVMVVAWAFWGFAALCNVPVLRRALVTNKVFALFKRLLPPVSSTERDALEAGTVWWDGELFSGKPDWQRLLSFRVTPLRPEEQAFLDGPTAELCAMLNDWEISSQHRQLPDEIWAFIRREGFLRMIIPKEHGGLQFSARAHSEVVMRISTRCPAAAVSVMVPNSLGPAELLMRYGTEAQKGHYLPRLARGDEVPCFALTSPQAGSDAASIPDHGVVCKGTHQGQEVLGLRLRWDKRYITLGPVATVLGLAFQTFDPDRLLGGAEDLGISLALIPTGHPGVRIGRRHAPAHQAFQNGPTTGHDVFIPMDFLIGDQERIGQGWRMLMNCLAVGRSISLPALSTGAIQFCARYSSAYARLRRQFGVPIARFEGVEERLARLAGEAYAVEAARRLTASAVDAGEEPAVVSALLKYQATERMRLAVNDAMDIHGGRAICTGPNNYLMSLYDAVPIGITVEGANILTRSLIVFGQGALRCHPWLMKEVDAALLPDRRAGLLAFDAAFMGHVGHALGNLFRATLLNWTGGQMSHGPTDEATSYWYIQVDRVSATFALVAEAALMLLGGALKRAERLSGRFADILSEMYLMSAVLKRYEDEGQRAEDLPLVAWCCHTSLRRVEVSFDEILHNFPSPVVGQLLRCLVRPLGRTRRPVPDDLDHQVALCLLTDGEQRERLTVGVYQSPDPTDVTGAIEAAWRLLPQIDEIEDKLRRAERDGRIHGLTRGARIADAGTQGILAVEDLAFLTENGVLLKKVISVDDFAPEEISAG